MEEALWVLSVEEERAEDEVVLVCVLGLQTVLCVFQCLVWHSFPQYQVLPHPVHFLSFSDVLPQKLHLLRSFVELLVIAAEKEEEEEDVVILPVVVV